MPKINLDLEMFPQHVLQTTVLKVDLLLGQDLRRNWPGTTLNEEQLEDGGNQLFPERANRRARQFKNLKREVSAMATYPDSGSLALCPKLKL
jgi:hypothetical protein